MPTYASSPSTRRPSARGRRNVSTGAGKQPAIESRAMLSSSARHAHSGAYQSLPGRVRHSTSVRSMSVPTERLQPFPVARPPRARTTAPKPASGFVNVEFGCGARRREGDNCRGGPEEREHAWVLSKRSAVDEVVSRPQSFPSRVLAYRSRHDDGLSRWQRRASPAIRTTVFRRQNPIRFARVSAARSMP